MRRVELMLHPPTSVGARRLAAVAVPLFVTLGHAELLGLPVHQRHGDRPALPVGRCGLRPGRHGRAVPDGLRRHRGAHDGPGEPLASACRSRCCIVVAGLVAVPFGIAVGLPALRLRGLNLAIVTLELRRRGRRGRSTRSDSPAARRSRSCPGRTGRPRIAAYFLLCWACSWRAGGWCRGWARGAGGAAWLAVRSSERATAATGLSVPRVKLTAFAVSAFLAGVAGVAAGRGARPAQRHRVRSAPVADHLRAGGHGRRPVSGRGGARRHARRLPARAAPPGRPPAGSRRRDLRGRARPRDSPRAAAERRRTSARPDGACISRYRPPGRPARCHPCGRTDDAGPGRGPSRHPSSVLDAPT